MVSLILVLLSIALFSLFLIIGVNYLNYDTIRGEGYTREIRTSMSNIGMALNSYNRVNGFYPSTETDLLNALFPEYGKRADLSFESNIYLSESSNYICISSPNQDSIKYAFDSLSNNHSYSYFVSGECGDPEVITENNLILSYEF